MIDLNALEALEKAATAGPWSGIGGSSIEDSNEQTICLFYTESEGCECCGPQNNYFPNETDNAAFIAAARNAMPELLRLARIGMIREVLQ